MLVHVIRLGKEITEDKKNEHPYTCQLVQVCVRVRCMCVEVLLIWSTLLGNGNMFSLLSIPFYPSNSILGKQGCFPTSLSIIIIYRFLSLFSISILVHRLGSPCFLESQNAILLTLQEEWMCREAPHTRQATAYWESDLCKGQTHGMMHVFRSVPGPRPTLIKMESTLWPEANYLMESRNKSLSSMHYLLRDFNSILSITMLLFIVMENGSYWDAYFWVLIKIWRPIVPWIFPL